MYFLDKVANSQERKVVLDDHHPNQRHSKGPNQEGMRSPSPNSDLDIANYWALTRVGLRNTFTHNLLPRLPPVV